jgi:hypothetical protein
LEEEMKIRFWSGVGLGALLALLIVFGGRVLNPAAMAARPPATPQVVDQGGLVASYGVGGVLTRDGELWQYRPDKGRWMTLDESFALEKTKTRLVPLPVPADQVKAMQTFGFIVTRSDECWLYDMDAQAWKNIGAPPFHDPGR